MPSPPTTPAPKLLPFHGDGVGWEHFESFCLAFMAAGTSLPNPGVSATAPARLRILDAVRYGSAGHKQQGIDFLAKMANQATWVLQCKHKPSFAESDAKKAIKKAESEFGSRHPVARYLLWVTGTVAPAALSLVHNHHPNWTLWSGEEVSNQFLLHCPRRQAVEIISRSFGAQWAKVFFPLPDSLLIEVGDFFSRWEGAERLFHHQATFVGREKTLAKVVDFARGGRGNRVLILSAPGGIGKTRFLGAVAERVSEANPDRCLRFTNPEGAADAEPPRYNDVSKLTVFHDDAHRVETLSKLLLRILADRKVDGSRLILATRPDAVDALRDRLMEAGYSGDKIEPVELKKLRQNEMQQLAAACLGLSHSHLAQSLSEIAQDCALIAVVGGELIRQGKLTHLDLNQSSHFREEVFRRFEGQELDRLSGSLDRPIVEKLLRGIALLSPWDHLATQETGAMANFLGINRGQLDSAVDRLRASGLLLAASKGLRITPDLFSDHLVYAACYDPQGRTTEFINRFFGQFQGTHSQTILINVAVTEWRANQQHGNSTRSVIAPLWERFRKVFAEASFRQRVEMLERWKPFAVYQPKRTLELAEWALSLPTAPQTDPAPTVVESFFGLDTGSKTAEHLWSELPGLLKPVAIWSDEYRSRALDLLWRIRRDFPGDSSGSLGKIDEVFREVASFAQNFPAAPRGLLNWLEDLLISNDACNIVDRPNGFLSVVLAPYFVPVVKKSWVKDERTVEFAEIPVSLPKTKELRDRALSILTDKIIPRGTVAALNALPVLIRAFSQRGSFDHVSADVQQKWRPERLRALEAIEGVAKRHQNELVHYSIRHRLRDYMVYNWGVEFRPDCQRIVGLLPDTFELRLARFTLSRDHADLFEPYTPQSRDQYMERQKRQWQELKGKLTEEVVAKFVSARELHDFLNKWAKSCMGHELSPRFEELLQEISRRDQALGFELLENIYSETSSLLGPVAAALVDVSSDEFSPSAERAIVRGLESGRPEIVRSFLRYIQYGDRSIPAVVEESLARVALESEGSVLLTLFELVGYTKKIGTARRLSRALLNRQLQDDQVEKLADSVRLNLVGGKGEIEDEVVFRLLDRLAESQVLTTDFNEIGFLPEAARRFPRRVYEFFLRRIEKTPDEDRANYIAIPYSTSLSLQGLENELGYEKLARELYGRVFAAPKNRRYPWIELFRMAVSMISPFVETLLTDNLLQINNVDDLADVASMLGFDGSLLVFQYPRLTEALLSRARAFGSEASDRIVRNLIVHSGPQGRGYSNGELDSEYRYLQAEAEKATQVHESNPILAPFYRQILEWELRDREWHRREYASRVDEEC